jgi:hypothetical protein
MRDLLFLRTINFTVHFLAPDDFSTKKGGNLVGYVLGFCGNFPESLFSFMKALGLDFSSLSQQNSRILKFGSRLCQGNLIAVMATSPGPRN